MRRVKRRRLEPESILPLGNGAIAERRTLSARAAPNRNVPRSAISRRIVE